MKLISNFVELCSRNPGSVRFCPETTPTHPTDPPEPGLGYLCLLLVKFEKKFLSPERRLIALTGRLAGPDGWQAPFLFIYLCCVSESEPSNASTCHLPGR